MTTTERPKTPKPVFIRPNQVQALYGIHRCTLYKMRSRGEITIHKQRGSAFIRVADIEAYIEGKKVLEG